MNLEYTRITDHTLSSFDVLFKVIVIGDSAVGKSCLKERIMFDTFEP